MPNIHLARRAALLAVSIFLVAFAVLALPAGALATIHSFNATINAAQEVPPTGTGGTGTGTVTYNDVSGILGWTVTWSGLTGAATLMHFHGPAAIGVNAGVQVDIGAISGLTSPSTGSVAISAAQGAQLLAGLWYINIHTALNGGGEIRGQVLEIPASIPTLGTVGLGVLLLTLAAAGGLMLYRRRRV